MPSFSLELAGRRNMIMASASSSEEAAALEALEDLLHWERLQPARSRRIVLEITNRGPATMAHAGEGGLDDGCG